MNKTFNNYRTLWFDAMTVEGDKGWIFANNFNELYEINLLSYELKLLGSVPGEEFFTGGLYFNILKCGQELVLIPAMASRVAIYSLETKDFKTIPIEAEGYKCFGAVTYNDKVFMVGNSNAYIFILDLQTYSIQRIDECVKYFESETHVTGRTYFRKNRCVIDNYYYIASCVNNSIVKLNMDTNQLDIIELDVDSDGFRSISYGEGYFWITKWESNALLRWDGESKECIDVFNENVDSFRSSEIIIADKKVFVFPTLGRHIYYYDLQDKSVHVEEYLDKYLKDKNDYPWGNQKITSAIEHNGYMWLYSADCLSLLKYDYHTHIVETINMDFEEGHRIIKHMGNEIMLIEGKDIKLEEYIYSLL